MRLKDFRHTEPQFDLFEYFHGQTKAWGIFEDRFGNLKKQFVVDIQGSLEADELVLDERFIYSDGQRDVRVWRIKESKKGVYSGRADDVVGLANGKACGNALRWSYDVNLQVGNATWRVHFDDWMFLQPGGTLINRAKIKKFGIELGQVTLFFSKDDLSSGISDTATVQENVA